MRPLPYGPKNRGSADQQRITFPRSSSGSKFDRPDHKQQSDSNYFTPYSNFGLSSPATRQNQHNLMTHIQTPTSHPKRILSLPSQKLTATTQNISTSSQALQESSSADGRARQLHQQSSTSQSRSEQLQSQASTTPSTSFSSSSSAQSPQTSSSSPVFPPPLPTVAVRGKRRSKRAPQPHASPSNVFEPALATCKAGAARDINQKCRDT